MKRICLISSVLATAALALPSTANAEPGILYLPDGPVTLRPAGEGVCSGMGGQDNSALGCTSAVTAETEITPANSGAIFDGFVAALADYDVMVTRDRPPEYIAYHMLLAGDMPNEESTGFSCASEASNCAALKRNDIAFTNGGTMNCTDPDALHAALAAFGRLSGLEGSDNVNDPMGYPPDYTNAVSTYDDNCGTRVGVYNEEGVEQPLSCTNGDHNGCDADMVNSVADLMAFYEARVEDTDPPVLSNITPEEGTEFQPGDTFPMNVTIEDADPIVGVRWTIQSDALVMDDFPDGTVTKCTNDVCTLGWPETSKPTDSDWSFNEISAPDINGDYVITLEVSDYHGNVAETVTINVNVGGASMTDATATADDTTDSGFEDTGDDTGDDESSGGGSGASGDDGGDDGGCGCTTAPQGGFAVLLVGLLGFGLRRRRGLR